MDSIQEPSSIVAKGLKLSDSQSVQPETFGKSVDVSQKLKSETELYNLVR